MTDWLNEIKDRAEAATPGPWRVEDHQPSLTRLVVSEDHMLDVSLGYVGNRTQADAAFIAEARADIPWLLDRITQLTAELDQAKAENRDLIRALGLNEEAAA